MFEIGAAHPSEPNPSLGDRFYEAFAFQSDDRLSDRGGAHAEAPCQLAWQEDGPFRPLPTDQESA